MTEFPALLPQFLETPSLEALSPPQVSSHPPRVLLLYGSLRERSYSRLLTEEAARILERLGAEPRIFDPRGLPLPDAVSADHPKVQGDRDVPASQPVAHDAGADNDGEQQGRPQRLGG